MMRMSRLLVAAALLTALAQPSRASAARILFVADGDGDLSLVTLLEAAGHEVVSVTEDFDEGSNARLTDPIGAFDALYWSADGGEHTDPLVFERIEAFVEAGGRLLITGQNALVEPADLLLIDLIGATAARGSAGPGRTVNREQLGLTIGGEDLRERLTSVDGETNCVRGLRPGTLSIVASSADASCHHWTHRTLGRGEIVYLTGGTSSPWLTDTVYDGAARNYAAAAGSDEREADGPELGVEAPLVVGEAAEITLEASVGHPDSLDVTFSWDLDGDGVFGDEDGEVSVTIPAGSTVGPSLLSIGLEATDAEGRRSVLVRPIAIQNLPPEITSRPMQTTRPGALYTYQVEAEDPAGDPITFELLRGPETMTMSESGLVEWEPGVEDITPAGLAVRVEVRAVDDDGAADVQRFSIVVANNRSPSPPVIVYPTGQIHDAMPRLLVENAVDPDGDALTYRFVIDSDESLESDDAIGSGAIPETPGATGFELTTALEPGVYHWRAWVSDGVVEVASAPASFTLLEWVDLPDGGAADAGVVDASVSADGGPEESGGCRVGRGGSPSAPLCFGLVVLGLALRRRRAAQHGRRVQAVAP